MGARGPQKTGKGKLPLSFRVTPEIFQKVQEEQEFYSSRSDCLSSLVESGLENVQKGSCPKCYSGTLLEGSVPG